MDPNLFHLDWERTFEVLTAIVVLAFLMERALAVLFESRVWVCSRMDRGVGKEVIALLAGCAVCVAWQFDAVSMILLTERVSYPGQLITGAVIAGGSKASVKLFRDLLDVKSGAVRQKETAARSA